MEIKFHGHACFSIGDNNFTLVTDPYGADAGLTLPALSAGAVTVSHDSPAHSNAKAVGGEPRVFSWPGEYEIGGIHFKGIHSFHNSKDDEEQKENVIFHFVWNDIRFCHLGGQGTKLTSEQLERVGDVDVLFVPAGSLRCDPKKAKEIVEQIEPRVIIPMTYHTEGSAAGLNPLEPFLSAMGAKNAEPIDVFKVRRSELPEDNSKLIIMNVTGV